MERKQTIRVLRDPSTGLGFGLNNGSDGLPEVGIVVPGSPAARVGLRRGDKVARINGHSTEGVQGSEFVKVLLQADTTGVDLDIVDSGGDRPSSRGTEKAEGSATRRNYDQASPRPVYWPPSSSSSGSRLVSPRRLLVPQSSAPNDDTDVVHPRPTDHLELRAEIIQTCLDMDAIGINQGTSGNVSARVPGGFLITPSGLPYNKMTPEQIVFMNNAGEYFGDFLPSSEWRMHWDVYKAKEDAQAIVHAHPTFCTAVSANRVGIPAFHYMVGIAGGKCIPCAAYGTFGTQQLSDNIISALGIDGGRKACLMANHGMIAYGKSLKSALKVSHEIEILAKQYMHASMFGKPTILPDSEMEVILAKFKTYGLQMADIERMGTFSKQHAVVPPPKREWTP